MQTLRTHVAGVDVHKDFLVITVLIGQHDQDVEVVQFESLTFTDDLIACGLKLKDLGVTDVAMESTGVYWKAPFNVWNPMGIHVVVGQAAHMKNVPGRKTDMNDSHWIAKLHRFGLIRPSFIPENEFQRMRLVSRHRTNLTSDAATIKNRIQRVLEDGNVKFGSIVSDVFGRAGRNVLQAISEGVIDAESLSRQVDTKIQRKEDIKKSLTNCLTRTHCFLIKELLIQLSNLEKQILNAEMDLAEKVKPYQDYIEKLKEIPGISDILAMGLLSEATIEMQKFEDERKFAAWAGVAAGNNESGGKKKDPIAVKEIQI